MVNNKQLAERLLSAMGSYTPATEAIRRENFETDDAYLDAITDYELKMNDPKRAEIRRRYARELQQQREAEAAEVRAAKHAEITANVKLTPEERSRAAEAATAETLQALKDGKIGVDDYSRAFDARFKEIEARAIEEKAGQAIFNSEIREAYRATVGLTESEAAQMSRDTMLSVTGGNTGGNAY